MVEYDPILAGKKFSQARKLSGWNQFDLALELGYSNNSQLSEFENWALVDNRDYTEHQLKLITKFYKKMIDSDNFEYKGAVEQLLDS